MLSFILNNLAKLRLKIGTCITEETFVKREKGDPGGLAGKSKEDEKRTSCRNGSTWRTDGSATRIPTTAIPPPRLAATVNGSPYPFHPFATLTHPHNRGGAPRFSPPLTSPPTPPSHLSLVHLALYPSLYSSTRLSFSLHFYHAFSVLSVHLRPQISASLLQQLPSSETFPSFKIFFSSLWLVLVFSSHSHNSEKTYLRSATNVFRGQRIWVILKCRQFFFGFVSLNFLKRKFELFDNYVNAICKKMKYVSMLRKKIWI